MSTTPLKFHKVSALPALAAIQPSTVYIVANGVDKFDFYISNAAGDAVRSISGDFLPLSGGTLTGALTVFNETSNDSINFNANDQPSVNMLVNGVSVSHIAALASFTQYARLHSNGTDHSFFRLFENSFSFNKDLVVDSGTVSVTASVGTNPQHIYNRDGLNESLVASLPTFLLMRKSGNATTPANDFRVYSTYAYSERRLITGEPTDETHSDETYTTKGYVDSLAAPDVVGAAAAGSTLGLEQGLLAKAGQPGLTVLAVGYVTDSGKVQGVSLGDGNVVEVYASGADFSAGNVLYREFMEQGEPICFTGLATGAIIQASQGFYGFSEQLDASDMSPMPLLSYGLSFKSTFFYGFRNCNTYDPGGTSTNQGWVHIVNGPLASEVTLKNGSGNVVEGQTGIALQPWEYVRLYTNANSEYILEATNPIMACHAASMDLNPHGRFYDSRLIMPLTNDGITWPRSGFISAPYNNTQVKFYTRDNVDGLINSTAGTGVSPGSPVDFDAGVGVGTGASDTDYEPNGATRVRATGLISAYSGADSAGLEASPLMPTSAMSQVVAQPLAIADNGDGGNSGVAIASPFVGTAKIYQWNDTTKQLDLAYTVPLNRSGVTVTSKIDQYHPSAGLVANETMEGAVALVGQLNPGVIIADVPITVVVQNGDQLLEPSIRSQNGTTTTQIRSNDDETLTLGVTPAILKAEITEGADGIFYRREISGGTETWVVA